MKTTRILQASMAALVVVSVGCAVAEAPPRLIAANDRIATDASKLHDSAGGVRASGATSPRPALTAEGARQVVARFVVEAERLGTTGVVAVVDDGGNLMALERRDGTFAAGSRISIGKARTAALFKKPTRVFEDVIRKGRTPMLALDDFTPLQGGVPIVVDGVVVGAVGVSGAASADQDDLLATVASRALQEGAQPSPATVSAPAEAPHPVAPSTAAVTRFPAADVSAAFKHGAPLLELGDFKIHASRRDGPGKAEVHDADTDVLYVLSGRAQLRTGGTVVEPQSIGPGETRGARIEGGEAHEMRAGDVIVVPRGVPHWFERVGEPVTYYTVKVTK